MLFEHFDVGHPLDARDFEAVYSLLEGAFPPSERRRKREQEALLKNPNYHLVAGRNEEGGISAFFAWWAFETFSYGEHFAVDAGLRGKGIGGEMLDFLVGARRDSGFFVLEVEPPSTETAARRIGFYQRHGFILNEYDYIQPSLRPECGPQPLMIMSHPAALRREVFESARAGLYKEVYKA